MRNLLIVSFVFAASCNLEQSEQRQTSTSDTAKQAENAARNTVIKTTFKPLINKKELLGVWESENKEPLTVEISEDSIFYTEHFESHKYKLKGDSIFINYPDFVYAGKVYFDKDTLIIESEDGKVKYVKFNK
jgi:hypothetical protein